MVTPPLPGNRGRVSKGTQFPFSTIVLCSITVLAGATILILPARGETITFDVWINQSVVNNSYTPFAGDFYLDSYGGNDANDGGSPARAWRTLAHASTQNFAPGERLLLRRGQTFAGTLDLGFETGSAANPIIVSTYGAGAARPVIDATGQNWAVKLDSSRYIEIEDLELIGKGVAMHTWGTPPTPSVYSHIHLRDLHIHDTTDNSATGGTIGTGIDFLVSNDGARTFSDLSISGCVIENCSGYGITINKWAGGAEGVNAFYHENVSILNNTIATLHDAGMQVGKIRNGLIRGNTVTDPGGGGTGTGSGLWTWYCQDFVVEKNVFSGARGRTDACGAHIDIGNVNNIFQHNLSIDNEGGFVEILGGNHNCVYRYNISINDGARVKGVNGAFQDGKTFWLDGYTGNGNPAAGPYNSYIYNNTIYVRPDIVSNYLIEGTAAGALFANNVVYVAGSARDPTPGASPTDIIFDHNLVFENKVPATPFNTFINNWAADPQFANAGGFDPADYVPLNKSQVINLGIDLYLVPGDGAGVSGGFAVTGDFFGNPIIGLPDAGAIECSAAVHWLVQHGFAPDTGFSTDANGDGVTLLEAYALDLDPNASNAGNMPEAALSNDEGFLEMVFYGQAPGITYGVEQSTDFQAWTTLDEGLLSPPDLNGMITAAAPTPATGAKLFLRLVLTLP